MAIAQKTSTKIHVNNLHLGKTWRGPRIG